MPAGTALKKDAAMDIFLGTLFVVICILLIVVVLLQRGRGGGLGAAFGGAGSSAFGTRTGDVFTWVTIVLTGLFLLLAIGTNFLFRPEREQVEPPTFTPAPSEISEPVEVALASETPGATIRYTLDPDEELTEDSTWYKRGILVKVEPGQTLRAQAFRKRWIPSEVVSATYPKAPPQVATPRFDPEPGEIREPVEVMVVSDTEGATVRYTTDMTVPTEESPAATGLIRVVPGATIKARAYKDGYRPSELAVAYYAEDLTPATAPATAPAATAPAGGVE